MLTRGAGGVKARGERRRGRGAEEVAWGGRERRAGSQRLSAQRRQGLFLRGLWRASRVMSLRTSRRSRRRSGLGKPTRRWSRDLARNRHRTRASATVPRTTSLSTMETSVNSLVASPRSSRMPPEEPMRIRSSKPVSVDVGRGRDESIRPVSLPRPLLGHAPCPVREEYRDDLNGIGAVHSPLSPYRLMIGSRTLSSIAPSVVTMT